MATTSTNPFEQETLKDSIYAKAFSALRDDSQFNAAQAGFDENKGVAGRVKTLTSEASPLWQQARTSAKQQAAKRGLTNSTMAAQAGEQAVISTATPIASADASLYQQTQIANAQLANAANAANAAARTNIGLAGINADIQGRQFDVTTGLQKQQIDNQASQFGQQLAQQNAQFGVTAAQAQQQIDAQREQFAQQLGLSMKDLELKRDQLSQQDQQFLANLDLQKSQLAQQAEQFGMTRADNLAMFNQDLAQKAEQFGMSQKQQADLFAVSEANKLKMAEIEAKYKNEIQSNTNISNAWGSLMQGIAQIQGNPELGEDTKAVLIENNIQSFQAFTNFWNKATGGAVDVSDLLKFGVVQAPGKTSEGGGGGGQTFVPPVYFEPGGD